MPPSPLTTHRNRRESTSESPHDASDYPTPSPRSSRSSDDLPMIGGADTYELRPLASGSRSTRRDGNGDGLRIPHAEDEGLLPSPRRFSIDSVQSFELYTPDEDHKVLRKLDRRLVAFMALLYCLSFLDRSNIGNAKIAGLAEDLNLSSQQYEWLLWAFYITYIGFEWMTLLYRVVPPHIYISICILSWGIIASLQAIATSFGVLLFLRALLGIGEAAFGPGAPFYLSFFFRRHELAFRTGIFISASPLSASFAGALAWLITKLGENSPMSPWRLLFLLEGFPSVLVAVWAWDFIPDGPGVAKWLSPREREVAVLRLRQEKEEQEEEHLREKYSHGQRRGRVNFREVLKTLKDPKCYLTALMFFSCNVAFSSMPVFLPTILRDMGYESITAQGLSAPPYLVAFLVVLLTAYFSDRLRTRSTFIIVHSLLATFGYGSIAVLGHYKSSYTTLRYLALYPATAGFFSAITIIITWTINNQESDSQKGTGMAILNVIGQMGPLVGTSIFPKEDGPWYVRGMTICAIFMSLVGILATVLRLVLQRQNKRSRDEKASGDYAGVPVEEGGAARIERRPFDYERPSSIAGSARANDSQESFHEKGPDSERSSLDLRIEAPANDFKPEADTESMKFNGEEEDPAVPVSFQRTSSPTAMHKTKGAAYEKVGEDGINRMHKFSLYETSTRFYLVGADIMDKHYRVLKIDRTAPPGHLSIFEDDIVYDKREMNLLLNAIDDGNKGTGGMKLKCSTWAYYMLLITKRLQVAMVGGHYIYQVDGTELIPLTTGPTSRFQKDRNPEEARFLGILNNLDFTRYFYFSYSYNITRSLQQNIIRERIAINEGRAHPNRDFQDMFPARETLKNVYDWCHPSSINVFGRRVRSRFFAGARFLKRGANDLGYVANDVETEQIVSEALNTSFHAPGPRLGSIPLYWTQDAADPFYSPAALHFDHLFERYGAPVYVLNLIKARERTPRESKLLHEYKDAIDYLNQSLPKDKQTRGQDKVLRLTGFFHNGDTEFDSPQVQNGVVRTNSQFLQALGVIAGTTVEYDSDCVDIFTHMFHGHGDAIAIQYGGSHLINQWQSSSRDMVESFKRYYHNSFLDSQRQEAYNLFLGNYIFSQGQPMLWDLQTDYYLHHEDPRSNYIHWYTPEFLEPRFLPPSTISPREQKEIAAGGVAPHDDYWLEYYRPLAISSFLKIFAFRLNCPPKEAKDSSYPARKDDMSPFVIRKKQHDHESPGKDNKKPHRKGVTIVDPSSDTESQQNSIIARRRRDMHLAIPEHGSPLKQSILRDPHFETGPMSAPPTAGTFSLSTSTITGLTSSMRNNFKPADKALINQWTLTQFYENSLNPSVSAPEEEEYTRYVEHPLQLPLVVSSETPSADDPSALEFHEYLCMDDKGLQDLHLQAQQSRAADSDEADRRATLADLPRLDTDAASIRSNFSMRPASAAGPIPFSHAPHHQAHPHPHHPHHSHTHLHTTHSANLHPPSYPHAYHAAANSERDPEPVLPNKFQTPAEDVEEFEEFLRVKENPLDVEEEDGGMKRYKAYRQWLRGKSFFKQSKVDPEWQTQLPVR
ncbi:hypothetical protein BS50DRAFT_613134 [Corynespora cassiicola Philippines]|uniref:Major facilitator superfamily (MFS) profile domain-containing protein n=1 Tax=Corynespora cassiicola Philippines TaxID=1448308 RepID=A0A2T2N9J2_CORCC|nr:hypothetical protein BS50DRAFT_613134 [Corynespora cassiicola Philippines]